jgi:hypothetical protein
LGGYDALVQHPDRTLIKREPGAPLVGTMHRSLPLLLTALMRPTPNGRQQATKSRSPGQPPTLWATT